MYRNLLLFKIRQITRIYRFISLMIAVLFLSTAFQLHKEYYSLTEINYNTNEKALQISMRLFIDDIDLALKKHYDKSIELGAEEETEDVDRFLRMYLNQKFVLNVNDIPTLYDYLGKEFEKDVMYVYLEVVDIDSIGKISVQNSVLTELFYEQENIIKLFINDLNKSMILTKENDKGMLKF